VTESTLAALWDRETRWLRTIRSVNRLGFAFLFVTITLPWMLYAAAFAFALHDTLAHPAVHVAFAVVTVTGVTARVILHAMTSGERGMFWRDLALMPVRDLLLLAQWLAGSFGSTVVWRGVRVPVEDTGSAPTVFRPEPVKAFEVSDGG